MRFSRVILSFCAVATLNGCAFLIPPEQSAPRNNTVLGEPRRPQLNLNRAPQSSLTPRTDSATVANNAAPVLPAVDPAIQAKAEQELATSNNTAAPIAPATAADALGARRIPTENQQFQVAGNYPSFDGVPARPALVGPDSAQSRLSATQADLERARADAATRAETLGRDAAAEPSLLNVQPSPDTSVAPLAPTTVPANGEVRRVPNGNGASAAPVPAMAPVANNTPASLPATPNFAPPAPLGKLASVNVDAAPAVRAVGQQVAYAPAAARYSAPGGIVLRPPVPYEAPAPTAVSAPSAPQIVAARSGPALRPGDFDPLATSDNAPISTATSLPSLNAVINPSYATNGRTLAPSRYVERR